MTLRPHRLLTLALLACGPAGEEGQAPVDADGDGILDVHEGDADPDGDGIPNCLDLDSDGDTFSDALERGDDDLATLPFDADSDGIPNFLDLDSDGNGIADADERHLGAPRPDADGDGILDPHDLDDDGDGIPDTLEGAAGRVDTDRDGDPDHLDVDSDEDGIPDAVEGQPVRGGSLPDDDGDGLPDVRDLDSDGDGFADALEAGDDPTRPRDTDDDGRPDFRDRDSDNDGLADGDDHRVADDLSPDADRDGVRDGVEVQLGTDPRDPASLPLAPVYRVRARTDVEITRTLDVEVGRRRVDVIALLRMQRPAAGPATTAYARAVVEATRPRLLDVQADVAIGAAGYGTRYADAQSLYRDELGYSISPPLVPVAAPTGSRTATFDWPKTTRGYPNGAYAAMHLLMTGQGLDSNCDGIYDPDADVLPWRASASDPFGGDAGQIADELDETADSNMLPGLGLRPFAMPILLWDGLLGSDSGGPLDPEHGWSPEPCDALTSDSVSREIADRAGRVVVFDLTGSTRTGEGAWIGADRGPLQDRFLDVFDAYDDLDGDGERDDPLVVGSAWRDLDGDGDIDRHDIEAELDDPEFAASRTAEQLVPIIRHAIAARDFSRVEFVVSGDPHGIVQAFEPASAPVPEEGVAEIGVTFTLRGVVPPTATDQVFHMELVAAGDGEVALGAQPFYVVVPGRGLD